MADKLEIRRLRTLPAVLAPSTLYITRTVGNTKLVDITVTGDTIAEVRKIIGVTETTEIVNNILETWVPKRALKADLADRASSADRASVADTATSANTANTATSAGTADRLKGPVKISLVGDVTGSTTWSGTGDISINTTGGGTGPGPGPVNLPVLLLSDDFLDPDDTGLLTVSPGEPIQNCSIPGAAWGDDTIGTKTSMGLAADIEQQEARLRYSANDSDNSKYYGRLLYKCQFYMLPTIYNASNPNFISFSAGRGWEKGSFAFKLSRFVSEGEKKLKFKYGSYAQNEAVIPFDAGTFTVIASHDGNSINIQLIVMPSDSPTYYEFTANDFVTYDKDWGFLDVTISNSVELMNVSIEGL